MCTHQTCATKGHSPPLVLVHDGKERAVGVELEQLWRLRLLVDKDLVADLSLRLYLTRLLTLRPHQVVANEAVLPLLVAGAVQVTVL